MALGVEWLGAMRIGGYPSSAADMVISVSGYNATGKTTTARFLQERLTACGRRCRVLRFDTFFPSYYLTKKPRRRRESSGSDQASMREIEGQTGGWNKPFRWYHFANVLAAALVVLAVRLLAAHRVAVCDRFFIDRFVHYDPRGWWFRAAIRLAPSATVAIVLLPDMDAWEQRILARLAARHSITVAALSPAQREELIHVRQRYAALCRSKRNGVTLAINGRDACSATWSKLAPMIQTTRARALVA